MIFIYWLWMKVSPRKAQQHYLRKVIIPYLYKVLRNFVLDAITDPDALKNRIDIKDILRQKISLNGDDCIQLADLNIIISKGSVLFQLEHELDFHNQLLLHSDLKAILYRGLFYSVINNTELKKYINVEKFFIDKDSVICYFKVTTRFLTIVNKA